MSHLENSRIDAWIQKLLCWKIVIKCVSVSQGPARRTEPTASISAAGIQLGGIWKGCRARWGPWEKSNSGKLPRGTEGWGVGVIRAEEWGLPVGRGAQQSCWLGLGLWSSSWDCRGHSWRQQEVQRPEKSPSSFPSALQYWPAPRTRCDGSSPAGEPGRCGGRGVSAPAVQQRVGTGVELRTNRWLAPHLNLNELSKKKEKKKKKEQRRL